MLFSMEVVVLLRLNFFKKVLGLLLLGTWPFGSNETKVLDFGGTCDIVDISA